jgi:hypothetical protein
LLSLLETSRGTAAFDPRIDRRLSSQILAASGVFMRRVRGTTRLAMDHPTS